MRIYVFVCFILLIGCEKIPDICDELAYAETPEISDGFYMRGTLNGESWSAEYAEFASILYKGQPEFSLGGIIYNECGIPYYTVLLFSRREQFDFDRFVNEESSSVFYNYGQIDEHVITPKYDSLIISNDFENFVDFDYVAPDTSIIDGRFQLNLTKRDRYYEEGEPDNIKIENGEFRLERTFY